MSDDDEYIPCSARIEFSLNVSEKVKLTPDFITLNNATDILVTGYCKQLKKQIIAVT